MALCNLRYTNPAEVSPPGPLCLTNIDDWGTCSGRRNVIFLYLAKFYSTLIFIEIAVVSLAFPSCQEKTISCHQTWIFFILGAVCIFYKNSNSLGQFVIIFSLLTFQLTGTVRNFVYRGPRARPRGASRARPKWGP